MDKNIFESEKKTVRFGSGTFANISVMKLVNLILINKQKVPTINIKLSKLWKLLALNSRCRLLIEIDMLYNDILQNTLKIIIPYRKDYHLFRFHVPFLS